VGWGGMGWGGLGCVVVISHVADCGHTPQ